MIAKNLLAQGAHTELHQLLQLRFAAKDLQLSPQKNSRASLSGGARTRFRGRGMEFEEVRVYQPGDDIRTIDWRVTARTQVPYTKLFREERERPTFISVDQRSSLHFGSQRCFKSVLAAHLASLLSWAALGQGDRVGGLVFSDSEHKDIRPRRSKHAVLELLHHLHEYNLQLAKAPHTPSVTLRQILEDTRRLAKPGSAVNIVSDFHDYNLACEEQLYSLSRHCDVSLFHVGDPLESQLPLQQLLRISDGRQQLQLFTSKQLSNTFAQQFAAQFEQLNTLCKKLKIALYRFSTLVDATHSDELTQMRSIYAARGKRPRSQASQSQASQSQGGAR